MSCFIEFEFRVPLASIRGRSVWYCWLLRERFLPRGLSLPELPRFLSRFEMLVILFDTKFLSMELNDSRVCCDT